MFNLVYHICGNFQGKYIEFANFVLSLSNTNFYYRVMFYMKQVFKLQKPSSLVDKVVMKLLSGCYNLVIRLFGMYIYETVC